VSGGKFNRVAAFAHGGNDLEPSQSGMTLRDYFASGVIAALVSGPDEALDIAEGETVDQAIARHWLAEAKMAYLIADAMLKAREATS